MISFLLSPVGRTLAGLVIAAGLIVAAWFDGHSYGRAAERQAILTRSIETLRERTKVDDQIRDMDDAGLCRELGGLPDECARFGL